MNRFSVSPSLFSSVFLASLLCMWEPARSGAEEMVSSEIPSETVVMEGPAITGQMTVDSEVPVLSFTELSFTEEPKTLGGVLTMDVSEIGNEDVAFLKAHEQAHQEQAAQEQAVREHDSEDIDKSHNRQQPTHPKSDLSQTRSDSRKTKEEREAESVATSHVEFITGVEASTEEFDESALTESALTESALTSEPLNEKLTPPPSFGSVTRLEDLPPPIAPEATQALNQEEKLALEEHHNELQDQIRELASQIQQLHATQALDLENQDPTALSILQAQARGAIRERLQIQRRLENDAWTDTDPTQSPKSEATFQPDTIPEVVLNSPSLETEHISELTLSLRNIYKREREDGGTNQTFSGWVNDVLRTGKPEEALRTAHQIQRLQDSLDTRRNLENRAAKMPPSRAHALATNFEHEVNPLNEKLEDLSGNAERLREQFEQDRQSWQTLQQNIQTARQDQTTSTEDLALMEEQLLNAELAVTKSFQEWVDLQRKNQQSYKNTVSETNGQN